MKPTLSAQEATYAASSVNPLTRQDSSAFALVEKLLLLSIGAYFVAPVLSLVR